jgi:hypothetical protein
MKGLRPTLKETNSTHDSKLSRRKLQVAFIAGFTTEGCRLVTAFSSGGA